MSRRPWRVRRRRSLRGPRVWLWAVIPVAAALALGLPAPTNKAVLALRGMSGLPGEQGQCHVTRVIDGDTIDLTCPGQGTRRSRLLGFDAPELFSPRCLAEFTLAEKAKWGLRSRLLAARQINFTAQGHDRYGRDLVAVTVDGQPMAGLMIGAGLARAYDGGERGSWCG